MGRLIDILALRLACLNGDVKFFITSNLSISNFNCIQLKRPYKTYVNIAFTRYRSN